MSDRDFKIHLEKNAVKFTLHGVPNRPGIAAEIFIQLSSSGINAELVVQTAGHRATTDLALAVHSDDVEATHEQLDRIRDQIQFKSISVDEEIALITLEREDLVKVSGAAARMFRSIANHRINIDLISTSMCSITCLIAEESADTAYQALQREFSVKNRS